jgi:hypothetical protein
MNERIKELALQSNLTEVIDDTYLERNDWQPFVEKFAELIVKECVRHFNEDYQRDFDTLWREDLSKSIREHFGIE